MICKDCKFSELALRVAMAAGLCTCLADNVRADVVRLWPTAVVISNDVTVADVCELSIGDASILANAESQVIVGAPPPGGSIVLEANTVQTALRRAGVNLSTVVLTGSIQCAVSRPQGVVGAAVSSSQHAAVARPEDLTLRAAVERAFAKRAEPYGGQVELQFTRVEPQTLALSGPDFEFDLRVRGSRWLGVPVRIDVDVLANDETVQSFDFLVIATLRKQVVIARGPINQKATIRAEDVELAERHFDRVESIGVRELASVIGQRAKRFIGIGDAILPDVLEPVPLVKRGQLVDVYSVAGGVQIKSSAQAASSGGLGDVVELRRGDRRRERLTGTVVGPKTVMISGGGATSANDFDLGLALGVTRGR